MKRTLAAAIALLVSASAAASDYSRRAVTYEVRVTNVTAGIYFTPTLAVTHRSSIRLFSLGEEALPELATLAEAGDVGPLRGLLDTAVDDVTATYASNGLLGPGQSLTFTIEGNPARDRLSLAAMLLPTNDGFYAINSVDLPARGARTFRALGYDAGSEFNDELCENIPGPQCGGVGGSPESGGEGYVHVHPGTHGEAELLRASYDWRNPVAQVTVRRVR